MLIKDIVDINCVCILKSETKEDVLSELIELLNRAGIIPDVDKVKNAVFYREKLMSTGIGLGIAIPHVRLEGIKNITMAIGIKPQGISDYQSIDDILVKIVIMILAGKNQHREYIKLLSQIVTKMKKPSTIERLLSTKTQEDIYNIFKED